MNDQPLREPLPLQEVKTLAWLWKLCEVAGGFVVGELANK
jgi:hypothetical protein